MLGITNVKQTNAPATMDMGQHKQLAPHMEHQNVQPAQLDLSLMKMNVLRALQAGCQVQGGIVKPVQLELRLLRTHALVCNVLQICTALQGQTNAATVMMGVYPAQTRHLERCVLLESMLWEAKMYVQSVKQASIQV